MLKPKGPLLYEDGPCEQPVQEDIVNRDLITFIEDKRRSLGLSLADLARGYNPRKPHKMRRAYDGFLDTGKIHPAYLAFLARQLGFTLEEVQAMERLHEQRIHHQRDLFVAHFDLIEGHADLILATAAYRNITFYGMGLLTLWSGLHRPLTLGDLLLLYREGAWIAPSACCGPVHLIRAAGSPLCGSHQYHGFCRACHHMKYGHFDQFSRILKPVGDLVRPYPFEPSRETVETLVIALQMRRAN